ncbi:MAG: NADH-dependent [FeFe] hydrogenase, group A6 [Clostridia bacterium]|jgi:iron-only hydrogenase group A
MERIHLTIDGQEIAVPKGTTILKAAREAGVEIPTLCYLEGIHEIGACRVCVVEVKGAKTLLPSCITQVSEGMEVIIHSPRVRRARKSIINLLLSDHPEDCLSCGKAGRCELQEMARNLGIRDNPYVGEHSRQYYDESTPSIIRDSSKCILCGRYLSVCSQVQGVNAIAPIGRGFKTTISPAYRDELSEVSCVLCGQCTIVCPTGALMERRYTEEVWKALEDKDLHTVIQVAPAIRASIGEEFGMVPGTIVTGKLVTALKRMGFDKVFDTVFTADLTIVEEGHELLDRMEKGGKLPMITSCSPGWIKFIEHQYPDLLDHVSTCKSPQQMFGAIMKTYYAEKMGVDPKRIFTVSVMPCTAKKFEASRPEMGRDGYRDVDAVLTTRELADMLREACIDFNSLEDQPFDNPFDQGSGAGVIFGNTGGVMEAALRTVYELVTGQELPGLSMKAIRGLEGAKDAQVSLGDSEVRVAAAHGLSNVRILLEDIKEGRSPYQFIEIMCCPGGCIGGGGQPIPTNDEIRRARIEGLYREDEELAVRKSHENPVVQELYEDFLGEPLGELSHRLLHTHYTPRYTPK